jgi:hypothetical protein
MGMNTRLVRRSIVALVAVGLLVAIFVLRPSVPTGSSPPSDPQPAAPAAATMPAGKPAPRDSSASRPDDTPAAQAKTKLLDAYLFFFAALSAHHARGR